MTRRRLGDTLVGRGVITPQQLEAALQAQARDDHTVRRRLWRVLVDAGFVNDGAIAAALADMHGLMVVDLDTQIIDPGVARRIPQSIAVQHAIGRRPDRSRPVASRGHRCQGRRGVDSRRSRRGPPMSRRVVCDASAVVAMLLDAGPDGRWSTHSLRGADLAALSLLAFEAATIIRRHELAALITTDQAAQAHADLLDLDVESWPYELLAPRAWRLRRNLSACDASYVALAELLDATVVTLDRRTALPPDLRCTVTTP